MKRQFTFSIDTSQYYFWIILVMSVYIIFTLFSTSTSRLQIKNAELKGQNEMLKFNESKINESILVLQDSLKLIKSNNTALKTDLANHKTNYKTLIIEKDAKKNTIDSYDHNQLSGFLPKRYDKN